MFTPSIARVLINDLSLDRPFDYLIPPELRGRIEIGMLVDVPFGAGGKTRTACVVEFPAQSPFDKLKPLSGINGTRPSLPDALLKLAAWMAEY